MNLVIKYVIVKAKCETIADLIPQFQTLYQELFALQQPAVDSIMQRCKNILDRMLSLYADFMEHEAARKLPELEQWKKEYVSLSPKQAKELFAVIDEAESLVKEALGAK
jgi:hypothetical protein